MKPKNNNNGNTENTENKVMVEPIKVIAKVVNVVYSDTLKRVGIVLDKTFKGFNQDNKEIETDTFRLNAYTLAKQTSAFVPHIKMAQALALGKSVRPELFSLSLIGADIEMVRTFHEEGEERETLKEDGTPEVYEKDTWTTEITKVTPHIDPTFAPMLMEYVKPAPKTEVSANITIDPFNV